MNVRIMAYYWLNVIASLLVDCHCFIHNNNTAFWDDSDDGFDSSKGVFNNECKYSDRLYHIIRYTPPLRTLPYDFWFACDLGSMFVFLTCLHALFADVTAAQRYEKL